jgi:hypothetical protein
VSLGALVLDRLIKSADPAIKHGFHCLALVPAKVLPA